MKVPFLVQVRWLLALVTMLALAALACGGSTSQPTPVPPTSMPPTSVPPTVAPTKQPSGSTGGANVNLEVINQTQTDICYLYVTQVTSDTWGPDQLDDTETIPPGSSFTVTSIPEGSFDLLSEDCDHNVISWNYAVDLFGQNDFTLTVSGASDTLLLKNDSSKQICSLYISPPDATSWGRSQLNLEHPIDSGTERSFVIGPGIWDLRAETCGGLRLEHLGTTVGPGENPWSVTD